MFYVYILECSDNKYYVGMTSDLRHRLISHLSGNGSVFTKKHHPTSLYYVEEIKSRKDAIICETFYTKLFKLNKQELQLEKRYQNIFKETKEFINKHGNDCWHKIRSGELQ